MDKNGNAINWWKSDTAEQYLKKAKCLEDQYSKYFVSQVNLTVSKIIINVNLKLVKSRIFLGQW